jgi:hypothetical protein
MIIELLHSKLTEAGNIRKQALRREPLCDLVHMRLGPETKTYLKHVLDPSYNYYYTVKGLPPADPGGQYGDGALFGDMVQLLNALHSRGLSGHRADLEVGHFLHAAPPLLRDLFKWAIDRKLPGGTGRNIVNSVFPNLIYKQPYPGVKPWDGAAAEKFNWAAGIMVQEKADGMALMIDTESGEIRTRQGQEVSGQLEGLLKPFMLTVSPGFVWFVEANLLGDDWKLLPRPESNGIFNALFKTGRQVDPNKIVLTALDMIDSEEFYGNTKPTTPVEDRFQGLLDQVCDYNSCKNDMVTGWPEVDAVPHWIVYSLDEARAICQRIIADGGEGAIIKDPTAPYKDGKSGMKMKNEFECTLRVMGYKEHTKHEQWVGSLLCESEDGVLSTYVGSGLNEEAGHELDRTQGLRAFIGKLVEIRAEKISKNNALDLPRIIEIRKDKHRADTYAEVQAAYADSTAAKC